MKIVSPFPFAATVEGASSRSSFTSDESVEAAFSDYLQAFDTVGKARVKAHIEEEAKEFDPAAFLLRVRQFSLYDKARHDLMAEKNLDHHDVEGLSAEERALFESQVFERVRHELVQRMGAHHHCDCDDEIRLYRFAPFLTG